MREVVMAKPTYFDIVYEINPWMKGNVGKVDKGKASEQWHELKNALERNKVKVHVYEPEVESPDMVFTANHGIFLNNTFVATNFSKEERKEEMNHILPFIVQLTNVPNFVQCPYPWEGEAELFHYKDNVYIGGYGKRATKEALDWFEKEYGLDIVRMKIDDDRFYHLDTCLSVRNEKVFLYPEAFSKEEGCVEKLKEKIGQENVIEVGDEIALSFSLNCVQLEDVCIVGTENLNILKKLENLYNCKVEGVDMSEYINSGGSCFCSKLFVKKYESR
jgi:N-dimethylarginine dimethylaminohydrolase